jgi:hypothetical protein
MKGCTGSEDGFEVMMPTVVAGFLNCSDGVYMDWARQSTVVGRDGAAARKDRRRDLGSSALGRVTADVRAPAIL